MAWPTLSDWPWSKGSLSATSIPALIEVVSAAKEPFLLIYPDPAMPAKYCGQVYDLVHLEEQTSLVELFVDGMLAIDLKAMFNKINQRLADQTGQ
jgi:hypothetical protein